MTKLQLPATFTPTHQTAGLPGYPAIDCFAPAGTPVGSPVAGVVHRLSGHKPTPTAEPGGPYGWSVYIRTKAGVDYYLTHLGTRAVAFGTMVKRGDIIGTVANYARATNGVTPSHVHEGRHTP